MLEDVRQMWRSRRSRAHARGLKVKSATPQQHSAAPASPLTPSLIFHLHLPAIPGRIRHLSLETHCQDQAQLRHLLRVHPRISYFNFLCSFSIFLICKMGIIIVSITQIVVRLKCFARGKCLERCPPPDMISINNC